LASNFWGGTLKLAPHGTESAIESLIGLFQEFEYLAPFTVLLLCGVGLPLPEEITLIGSGILLYQDRVAFLPITLVCSLAILLGDSIPYSLGRRYGLRALRLPWVARVLHPERFASLERRFARHGNWAIFTCRFLPGMRIPGYFTAGTLRMPFLRFLALDVLGVLLSVPLSIYLGRLFGGQVERLQKEVRNFHHILAFAILSIVLVLVVHALVRGRERRSVETPPSEPPVGGPGD
jgi:membrane protein DedA with SNARE-associated domain